MPVLQEDGEGKLVFWQLHQMDTFRSRTSVRSNSKYQKFPLYSCLVSNKLIIRTCNGRSSLFLHINRGYEFVKMYVSDEARGDFSSSI